VRSLQQENRSIFYFNKVKSISNQDKLTRRWVTPDSRKKIVRAVAADDIESFQQIVGVRKVLTGAQEHRRPQQLKKFESLSAFEGTVSMAKLKGHSLYFWCYKNEHFWKLSIWWSAGKSVDFIKTPFTTF